MDTTAKLNATLIGLGGELLARDSKRIVVKLDHGYHPWVVWSYATDGSSVFWGHYHATSQEAFADFNND